MELDLLSCCTPLWALAQHNTSVRTNTRRKTDEPRREICIIPMERSSSSSKSPELWPQHRSTSSSALPAVRPSRMSELLQPGLSSAYYDRRRRTKESREIVMRYLRWYVKLWRFIFHSFALPIPFHFVAASGERVPEKKQSQKSPNRHDKKSRVKNWMSERGGEAAGKIYIYSTDACLVIQVVSEVILIEQCSNSLLLHKRSKNEFKNIFHFSHPTGWCSHHVGMFRARKGAD